MNIAVMGYGTVGSGVVEIINKRGKSFYGKSCKEALEVTHILDLRDFPGDENEGKFTKDFNDILNDESTEIVVETMGGTTPAFDFVSKCLSAGKHVVTSNKELVAEKGLELLEIAKEKNVNFMFEASVGGGIPIIRPLTVCLAANEIRSVNGILNGTTNFILTKMISDNMSFENALKIAQENGYAEKDPTADVEGHDACRKICILSSLVFGNHIYPKDVHCEGITKIMLEDVAYAASYDAVIKLIGTAEKLPDGKVYILVSPAVIRDSSQLSKVSDVFNAILVDGDETDEVLFYGKGAGKAPTASAVVADVIDCANHADNRRLIDWGEEKPELIANYREIPNEWYVRMHVNDSFQIVSSIKEKLGEVHLLARSGAGTHEIAFITSSFSENEIREKLTGIEGAEIKSLIRVAKC